MYNKRPSGSLDLNSKLMEPFRQGCQGGYCTYDSSTLIPSVKKAEEEETVRRSSSRRNETVDIVDFLPECGEGVINLSVGVNSNAVQ